VASGAGKTKTGGLRTYVRDERSRPASYLPASGDSSRTTCEHLDEHLLALSPGARNNRIKIINKINHLQ